MDIISNLVWLGGNRWELHTREDLSAEDVKQWVKSNHLMAGEFTVACDQKAHTRWFVEFL